MLLVLLSADSFLIFNCFFALSSSMFAFYVVWFAFGGKVFVFFLEQLLLHMLQMVEFQK